MEILFCILFAVAVIVVPTVIILVQRSNKEIAMDAHVAGIGDFVATQKILGVDGSTGLAIDEASQRICLIDLRGHTISSRIVSPRDLLSSELFEDGVTITQTKRASQIGGALIGALALGGLGAIIGGLSGKTRASGKATRVDLRLIVNDAKSPLHDINFLSGCELERDDITYQNIMRSARHWHGLLEVLIKRADTDDRNKVVDSSILSSSVADEVKKFAQLRDTGVLSVDEFERQKMKLLGS